MTYASKNKLFCHQGIFTFADEIIQYECLYSYVFVLLKNGDLLLHRLLFGGNHLPEMDSCNWYNLVMTNVKKISMGQDHLIILRHNGEVYGSGRCNYLSDKLIPIGNPQLLFADADIDHIECGVFHTIFSKKNGEIYGWGLSSKYQLGKRNISMDLTKGGIFECNKYNLSLVACIPNIIQICCSHSLTTILDTDGNVYACGQLSAEITDNFGLKYNGVCQLNDKSWPWSEYRLGFNMRGVNFYDMTKIISANNQNRICQIACSNSTIFIYEHDGQISEFGKKTGRIYPKIPGAVIFYHKRGDLVIIDRANKMWRFTEDKIDPIITSNVSTYRNAPIAKPINWSIENHHQYCSHFKHGIHTFYLVLKRIQFSQKLRIPKFVVYEIVKHC